MSRKRRSCLTTIIAVLTLCHDLCFGALTLQNSSSGSPTPSTDSLLSPGHQPDTVVCPCKVRPDTQYGGEFLDCSNQNLQVFLPEWTQPNTTTIDLRHNQLEALVDHSFDKSLGLKRLYLRHNKFRALNPRWFEYTAKLVVLDLEENQINLHRDVFAHGVFSSLTSLQELYLAANGNEQREGDYPDSMLAGLHQLTLLSLDTFAKDMDFGTVFHNSTTSLTSLRLTGGTRRFLHSSFQAYRPMPLKVLLFDHLSLLQDTHPEAFSPLKSLTNLRFDNTGQTIKKTFLSLKPFVGRNFESIQFDKIGYTRKQIEAFNGSKIISKSFSIYLRDICVERLILVNSEVVYLENDAFRSDTFARCLKSLDIRNNPLKGDFTTMWTLNHYAHLNSFFLSGALVRQPSWPTCVDLSTHSSPHQDSWEVGLNSRGSLSDKQDQGKTTPGDTSKAPPSTSHTEIPNRNDSGNKPKSVSLFPVNLSPVGVDQTLPYVFLPKTLKQLSIQALSSAMLRLRFNINFYPNKLQELYLSDNGIKEMTGQIRGLDNLNILDFSRNNATLMSPFFFDHFPSLKVLLMKQTKLDPYFITHFSSRLFGNLTNLQILDLSDNALDLLSHGTFKTTGLEVLVLAGNRFRSIPFSMTNVPRLCKLDLSYNSISRLTQREMADLESQWQRVGGSFSLSLRGNVISCSCSNFRFMRWLFTTKIIVDNGGNYSCLAADGELTYTHAFKDLEGFWRQCVGEKSLFISLILLSILVLAFVAAVLVVNFQTRLEAYFHQFILRSVKSKTPADYAIGVYIGYSNKDTDFACLQLNSFIERELGLTTFVRDRDAHANSYRDITAMNAIEQSWRVLLLVTSSYLADDSWSFYTMKVASSCVTATNQRRLVLMVEPGLEAHLPIELLQAAWGEDSVIRVDVTAPRLPAPLKQRLRQTLLPHQ